MTIRLIGTPQLSLLELTLLANEVGFPFEFLVKSSSISQVRFWWPSKMLVYSSLRVFYADSIEGFRNCRQFYSNHDTLGLLRISPTEIIDNGLPLLHEGIQPVTPDDLKGFLANFRLLPSAPAFKTDSNASAELLKDKSRDSLLSKLQSAFYRIRDKEERARVQGLAYKFLLSKNKKPSLGVEHLDRILSLDLTARFKEALRAIKSEPDINDVARDFGIDRFELAFVLKKNGKI